MLLSPPPNVSPFKALERLAQSRPRLYRWRVMALAAVGYAYILAWGGAFAMLGCGLFAALLYGIWTHHPALPTDGEGFMATLVVASVLIITAWVMAIVIARAFWITLPEPQGVPLRQALAPRFFALLHETGRPLGVGRLRRVVVTAAFDLYLHRAPRLGGLLPPADTLVIGLPVLQALSVAQLRILLLRELASLVCQRRQSAWVAWQGIVWRQLGPVIFLFDGLLRWYKPLFNRHLRVMVRQEDYQADAIAARHVDPTLLGHVLLLIEMMKRYHHVCYQKLLKQAERQPHPPTDGLCWWLADTAQAPPIEVQERWWQALLSVDDATDAADTDTDRPSLPSRLTQLGSVNLFGQRFQLSNVTERAADPLLGPYQRQLTRDLNQHWYLRIAADWSKRYDYVRTVNQIEHKVLQGPLTAQEIWLLAEWHLNEDDFRHGRQLLEQCVRLDPKHGPANFTLGKLLLIEGTDQGVQYLEKAMAVNSQWIDPACHLLLDFFAARDNTFQADRYAQRLQQHQQQLKRAQRERTTLHGQPFVPCPLPESERQKLCQQIARFKAVETAYLVEKQVQFFPEHPCYALVVVRRTRWYTLDTGTDQRLHQQLQSALELPDRTLLFVVSKQQAKAIAAVDQALLYSRSRSPHN